MPKICAHEGCSYFVFSDGYCQRHQYESTKYIAKQKEKRVKIKEAGGYLQKKVISKNHSPTSNSKHNKSKKINITELRHKAVPDDYKLNDLISRCDYLFSRYIRQKAKDNNGEACCYTCKKKMPWQKLQAGHFVPRIVYALRWDEFNTRPQCEDCNVFKEGNLVVYSALLMKENPQEMARVLKAKRTIFKLTRNDMLSLKYELTRLLEQNRFHYVR